MKGDFKTSGGGGQLRKVLVVFQFAVSIFLIVGTIVVQNQLAYIQNRKLGYNKDQVLVLPTDGKIRQNLERFKTEFEAIPNVQRVALGTETPTFVQGGYSIWEKANHRIFNWVSGLWRLIRLCACVGYEYCIGR
ncbi:MAG: hypothetical protein IPJ74_25175 [Saprospiraceae bacterium]|nr:hypothetical protein [Saprospiraceae bacterium]